MPELPEVETVRQSLLPLILNTAITDINIYRPRIAPNINAHIQNILNTKIINIHRQAKYLIFELSNQAILLGHLKMAGQFLYLSPNIDIHKHDHIIFDLDNNMQLRFRDVRCFGSIVYYNNIQTMYDETKLYNLAPEPLSEEFTIEYMNQYIQDNIKTTLSLKNILLDQKRLVSGLGNIYVDECLFASGIHPLFRLKDLSSNNIIDLYSNICNIIDKAIQRKGTTFKNYIDANGKQGQYADELNVYGRKNLPCKICTKHIEYTKVSGRGTYYCSNCQML